MARGGLRPSDNAVRLKKARFLEVHATTGNISETSRQTGTDRQTHYRWQHEDAEYAAAFAVAEEQAIDALETEARRRGLVGVEEPVFHRGEVVGSIQRYSDTLLIFLMKGARPEKYRERMDIRVNVDGIAEQMASEGMDKAQIMAEAEAILATRG